MRYWNSNENIGDYMIARAKAKHEIVLFLEHFPHVYEPWIGKNLDRFAVVNGGGRIPTSPV